MAKRKNYYLFKLKNDKRPASWGLKIKQLMLTKKDEGGRVIGKKFVQYVPGENSIFKEDHTDDKQPVIPTFENGILKVDKDDKPLLEILRRHPWYNVHYELIDEDAKAKNELEYQDKIVLALEKVNVSEEEKLRANGLVLIGYITSDWTPERIKAKLRDMAIKEPDTILNEMNNEDYRAKYIASLSLLKKVVLENESRTKVVWANTGETIINVAVGQSPVKKLGEFLAGNNDKALATLQELGEQIKRSYERKEPIDIDSEINALKNQGKNISSQSTEDVEIEELQKAFEEKFDKQPPNNKKNDAEWLLEKLNDATED